MPPETFIDGQPQEGGPALSLTGLVNTDKSAKLQTGKNQDFHLYSNCFQQEDFYVSRKLHSLDWVSGSNS
jgi:hypothetical protein